MPLSSNLPAVRFFTENDPYHYTVENRPLQDLESRDLYLASVIDSLVASSSSSMLKNVTGVNNITAASLGGLTSYATDTVYRFFSIGANTGNVTLSIDGLAAAQVLDNLGGQLQPGAIPGAGFLCMVQATAAGFILINAASYREIIQKFSGRLRTVTPAGGALVREWSDITTGTVVSTVGAMEYGITYNCDIDASGNWLNRDINDVCWVAKWSDVGGVYDIWTAPATGLINIPTWTLRYRLDPTNGVTFTNTMYHQMSGTTRVLTPAGGALIRELTDVITGTVASTVGAIEYGISYNCGVDPTTANWLGRDVTDICWLEKWTDVGGVKEYWYAPSAAAGVVPVWTKTVSIDVPSGNVTTTGRITPVNYTPNSKTWSATYATPTAGSAVLTNCDTIGFSVGDAVTVLGVGAAGANLATTITAVDSVNRTITLAAAVTTAPVYTTIYITSITWTVPAGVTSIMVECWGAGGGGGGALNTQTACSGGGGGAGGYGKGIYTVVPGTVYTITIGLGGAGCPHSSVAVGGVHVGSTGGTTSFGALLSCLGGFGGADVYAGSGGGSGGSPFGHTVIGYSGQAGATGTYMLGMTTTYQEGGNGGGMSGSKGAANTVIGGGKGSGGSGGGNNHGLFGNGSPGGHGMVVVYW